MPDLRRVEHPPAPDEQVARDSQAEGLLVDGLDKYFAGRYEDAIHLWTRVLFLDRSHTRARAYIDRARTALGEQQRHADEMLETSGALLDRGQTDAARHLIAEAVASSGDDERAAALRLRLERIERARAPRPAGRLPIVAAPEVIPRWSWRRRSRALVTAAVAAVSVAIVFVATNPVARGVMGLAGGGEAGMATAPAALPVLTVSEAALVRARTLYGRGRLAEALQTLERVDDESPIRQDANALKVEIQLWLLAGTPEHSGRPQASGGTPR